MSVWISLVTKVFSIFLMANGSVVIHSCAVYMDLFGETRCNTQWKLTEPVIKNHICIKWYKQTTLKSWRRGKTTLWSKTYSHQFYIPSSVWYCWASLYRIQVVSWNDTKRDPYFLKPSCIVQCLSLTDTWGNALCISISCQWRMHSVNSGTLPQRNRNNTEYPTKNCAMYISRGILKC